MRNYSCLRPYSLCKAYASASAIKTRQLVDESEWLIAYQFLLSRKLQDGDQREGEC